jgi:hypothetical protein
MIIIVKKYGKPAYDECFGYFPVLGAGGVEKVENLKKVKLTEYIYANTAVTGDLCKWLNFSMEVNEQRN